MAYSEKVLDHYENPRNVGSFDKGDTAVGTGMVGAPACGDVMKLQIKVSDEGIIEDARFKTYGCGSAIALKTSDVVAARAMAQSYSDIGIRQAGRNQGRRPLRVTPPRTIHRF